MNPSMVLVLFVRVRLLGVNDKTALCEQILVHETKKRLYKDWFFYYHFRFQEGIEKAYQNLAEQMVENLFLSKPTI